MKTLPVSITYAGKIQPDHSSSPRWTAMCCNTCLCLAQVIILKDSVSSLVFFHLVHISSIIGVCVLYRFVIKGGKNRNKCVNEVQFASPHIAYKNPLRQSHVCEVDGVAS